MLGLNINKSYRKLLVVLISGLLLFGFTACKFNESKKLAKKVDERITKEKYDEALELLDTAKEKINDSQELLRLKGIALIGNNDYAAAVESFESALKLSKKHIGSLEEDIIYYKSFALSKLGKTEEAYTSLEILTKGKGKKEALLLQGMLSLKLGRKHEAVLAFDKAIQKDKKNLKLYIDVFNAFAANNYLQSGKDYLSNGIKVAQKAGDNLSLGKLFYYNEEYEMAIKTLENELKKPEAKIYMAKSMYQKGDMESAYEIAENALNNKEESGEYYNIIGLYYMSNKEYKKALGSFTEGLRLNDLPNDCELRYNEAVTYEFMGDFSTAKQKMESVMEDYPELESAKREFLFLKTR